MIWSLLVRSTLQCLWVSSEGCGSDLLLCFRLEAEGALAYSANLSGNEDVISLSDIVPETKICFVSSATVNSHSTVLNRQCWFTAYIFSFFSTVKEKDKCLGQVEAFQEGVKQARDLLLHLHRMKDGCLMWHWLKQWFIGKTFLTIVHRRVQHISPKPKYFSNPPWKRQVNWQLCQQNTELLVFHLQWHNRQKNVCTFRNETVQWS